MMFPLALAAMIAIDKLVLEPRSSEDRRRRKKRRRIRVKRRRQAPTVVVPVSESEELPVPVQRPAPAMVPATSGGVPSEEFSLSPAESESIEEGGFSVEATPSIQPEAEGFTFSE